jgi:hypothetical protein
MRIGLPEVIFVAGVAFFGYVAFRILRIVFSRR